MDNKDYEYISYQEYLDLDNKDNKNYKVISFQDYLGLNDKDFNSFLKQSSKTEKEYQSLIKNYRKIDRKIEKQNELIRSR